MKPEQQATFLGMVLAAYLAAPEGDRVLQSQLLASVQHLARAHEVDAYEHAYSAIGLIAMAGIETPHDLDARIERLRGGP